MSFFLLAIGLLTPQAHATGPSILAGTDIPYQFHLGAAFDLQRIRFSVRSGLLTSPYSEGTLAFLDALGTPDVYVQLLEGSYQFGSMNSVGIQYLLGKDSRWSIGAEFRFDYLSASDTSSELIETVTGESIPTGGLLSSKEPEVRLGLLMYAAGLRVGYGIPLGAEKKHEVLIELSAYKHYATQSSTFINDEEASRINDSLNEILWTEVFLPYGYLGGVGISYRYSF